MFGQERRQWTEAAETLFRLKVYSFASGVRLWPNLAHDGQKLLKHYVGRVYFGQWCTPLVQEGEVVR